MRTKKNAMACRKKGAALIKRLNEEFPSDPSVLAQFAKLSVFDKELQLTILEQLVKVSPKDSDAHGQLGHLYIDKGRQKEAVAELREALLLADEAERLAEYAGGIAATLQTLGCPLTGMDELERMAYSMYPVRGVPEEMKKYAADVGELKKQMIGKLDGAWQMPGICILANSEKLTPEQRYEKGVQLLKDNDIGSSSASQEGQLSAIAEFNKAMELGLDYPHRSEVPMLLSRAYELCAEYDGRTKRATAKQKKNAEKCNTENGKLLSDHVANFPLKAQVMEQFEKFASRNPELQPSLNEMRARHAEGRAGTASVYLKKRDHEQAIRELKAAIALAVAPQKVAQYATSIDGSLQSMGCPLPALADMSARLQSMRLPLEVEGPKAKEKYSADFKAIKNQILENVDKHQCAK
jgi:tetratricopeptide (TPR) repeat protein